MTERVDYREGGVGYQRHSETSRDTAHEIVDSAAKQTEQLLCWIREAGMLGRTIDEGIVFLSEIYHRDMQASPRFRGLELLGKIVKTSCKRASRAGHPSTVYRIVGLTGQAVDPHQMPGMSSTTTVLPNLMPVPAGEVSTRPRPPAPPAAPRKPEPFISGMSGMTVAAYRDRLERTGHGHVVPQMNGNRVRCGGPGLCRECKQEQRYLKYLEDKEANDQSKT